MAVSRMLKIQLVAHASIKDEVKVFLREAGAVEITDVSIDGFRGTADAEDAGRVSRLGEKTDAAIQFLEPYTRKPSFAERLSGGPVPVSVAEVAATLAAVDAEEISRRASDIDSTLRSSRDELSWSAALVRELEPWRSFTSPFESLSTTNYGVQFWTFPEKAVSSALEQADRTYPSIVHEEIARSGGRAFVGVITPRGEAHAIAELLKQAGGVRNAFESLTGTPQSIIERQRDRRTGLEAKIDEAGAAARDLARVRPSLQVLSDHFHERRGLLDVERHFFHTERTFLLEGWIRAVDRRRLERDLTKRWSDLEIITRPPREGEDPPVSLANRRAAQPFEFIMTLYGRPLYSEVDPTPLLAPFFVLCFSLCMSDAGYGIVLTGICAVLLYKLKIRGGMRSLMQILFASGILTIIVGILMGGYFGIEIGKLPAFLGRLILIDPLSDPMSMLNIAFLIGIVHILFGMGVKMVVDFRAGLWADAIFDDLFWMLFLMTLVPLGYSFILGGAVPPAVNFYCSRAALGIAGVLFLSGIRKDKNVFIGIFRSLIKFYSLTSYFGDVLSYARLLALGLATSAIALAINGIAQMVSGLPYYTGIVAVFLVLLLGHTFNIMVNILGAFVHSARLQYLEFFNKFFTGGGREFRPFRSERRYTILKETGNRT